MGSGHILCVLFDVLVRIYEDYGYTAREAAGKIVANNLYGLDIDERAAQLAYFSVMMKARQYDRRFFSRGLQPMVYCTAGDEDGENFGALLTVDDPGETPEDPQSILELADYERRLNVWNYRSLLAQKYHVVATNPPYMGASNMNGKLSDFIKKNYPDYKSDSFSSFFVRCIQMTLPTGKLGFFSPYVWMFIQSYEKWRHLLFEQKTIETLIQFEYSAFEEATVPVCTFVFSNYHVNKRGCYLRLTDFRGGMEVQRKKTLEAIANHNCGYYYEQSADNFSKIPGAPVAYWVSESILSAFTHDTLQKNAITKQGFKTGDNDQFLRHWFEIEVQKSGVYGLRNVKWYPCTKGGEFRRWYGNLDYVVNWENDGFEIKHFVDNNGKLRSRPQNLQINFHPAISWSSISSSVIHFRTYDGKMMYESKGPVLLPNCHDEYLLGYVNSKVYQSFINIIAPTLDYSEGAVLKVPYYYQTELDDTVSSLVNLCVHDAKADWDSFETSWDFTRHPLVRGASSVAAAYAAWAAECDARFSRLKANEEELNRIFIGIYGLQDELAPEVEDKDVTVRKADLGRDIRSLISYAVGCMFGRYSLDAEGLAYAGGAWDAARYQTFQPDRDGILPICDDDYFEDDIMGRFAAWLEAAYGRQSLEENLSFIADALGGKGSPREVIRNYFLNGFYADHCKIYQKRPIYWLFDSGRKNGFKCLIYLHRYQPDTIARIRTDYVHEQQSRYRTAIADLEQSVNGAPTSERVKLSKRLAALRAQAEEIRVYEEKIHHLADQMLQIDLDDGVKRNYEVFQDVLAKIK